MPKSLISDIKLKRKALWTIFVLTVSTAMFCKQQDVLNFILSLTDSLLTCSDLHFESVMALPKIYSYKASGPTLSNCCFVY